MVRAYGRSYFPLAALKLLNDALLLVMPLLLKLLVEHIDQQTGPAGRGEPPLRSSFDGDAGSGLISSSSSSSRSIFEWLHALLTGQYAGYVFAGLLGAAAMVKAVLGAHYEYKMNVVSNR